MAPPPDELPDDPKQLKALYGKLWQHAQGLEQQLGKLMRRQYGSSSERHDPTQSRFEFAPEVNEAPAKPADKTVRVEPLGKAKRGRRPLPKHLPRRRIEYVPAPAELVCACCGADKKKIGEELSEQLEFVPSTLCVIQHVRIKFACAQCQDGVVVGPLPEKLIDKGLPGPGLLAQVLVSKYCDHLPLYRQEGIFGRHGLEVPRSTACQWIAWCAAQLGSVYACMKKEVLSSAKIHTDDTPVKVQEPGRGKTRTGRFWVYLGDDEHRHAVFQYTANRKRDGPAGFLSGYKGYLQADAYGGYDGLYVGNQIVEVACWAHARRKFFEAQDTDGRALDALALIGELYQVERAGEGLDAAALRELRQRQARTILIRIEAWLDARATDTLPKSPLGQAVQYALGQWKALNRYIENGILDIDNNKAENAVRPIALGRKNWLFCGNDKGGERAAVIYSLVHSCKLNDVEPWAYLRDVLQRISSHPASRILELTPAHWKPGQ